MARVAKRLLSVKLTLAVSTALLAGLLAQVSFTKADVQPCPTPTSGPSGSIGSSGPTGTGPTGSISIGAAGPSVAETETGTKTDACALVTEGGTVQTKPPTTPGNPIWTKLIFPPDFTGQVTIHEFEETPGGGGAGLSAQAAAECSFKTEYACLVSEVTTEPPSTEGKPWRFIFTIEEETFPFETNTHGIKEIHLYHNEVRVPSCGADRKLDPEQEACVLKKFVINSSNETLDEDVRFVVLTRTNGSWHPR